MNRYRGTIRLIAAWSSLLLVLASVLNFDGILGLRSNATDIVFISLGGTSCLSWVLVAAFDRRARIIAILMLAWLLYLSGLMPFLRTLGGH
jgi:hypothetical protein